MNLCLRGIFTSLFLYPRKELIKLPTVQSLLDDIDARLINTFTATQKISWINDVQNEIWRYMSITDLYEFDTVAGQTTYVMASDMSIDMIESVQVSDSTVIDGTEGYTMYEYAGVDDELSGCQYYDALGSIGIYPMPSTATGGGYNVKVTYDPSPVQLSTNTLTIVPSINAEYQDILKFRAMKVIAQSGNNPDVELANNYQREEDTMMNKIKMDYYKRNFRKPRDTYRRKESWWKG